jgi:hypothetical protein
MEERIIFEATIECPSCGGTGIYQGMAERDGAAVICYSCNGTGFKHIKQEYNKFTGIKKNLKVKRVYKTCGGYGISSNDTIGKDGQLIQFSKAGASYEDWLNDNTIELKPIKELHCPLIHYQQGTTIGENLKSRGPCNTKCRLDILECSKKNKAECWIEFKEEDYNKKDKE